MCFLILNLSGLRAFWYKCVNEYFQYWKQMPPTCLLVAQRDVSASIVGGNKTIILPFIVVNFYFDNDCKMYLGFPS